MIFIYSLFSVVGLKEINLFLNYKAVSSIISDKVNHLIPKIINKLFFKIIGNDTFIIISMEAVQL